MRQTSSVMITAATAILLALAPQQTAEAQFGFSFGGGGGRSGFSFGSSRGHSSFGSTRGQFGPRVSSGRRPSSSSSSSSSNLGATLFKAFAQGLANSQPPRRPTTFRPPVRRPVFTPSRQPTPTVVRRPVAVPRNNKPLVAPKTPRNSFSLNGGQAEQDVEDKTEELSEELDEQLSDQVDPKDKDELDKALEALDKGDPSKIDDMIADGKIPADLGEMRKKTGALEILMGQGGLTPKGADILIDQVEQDLNKRNPADPGTQALQDKLDELKQARQVQDLVNGLQGGGTLGTVLAGMPPGVEIPGLPIIADGEPIEDMDRWSPSLTAGILILNPEENAAAVAYVLNQQHTYTMQAGQVQKLGGGQWTIEFDRGNGTKARYGLTPGSYEFTATPAGWDLHRHGEYEVVIDNTQYAAEFHYVVDGKQAVVQSGGRGVHRSPYPIQISFDRADGGQPAHKRLRSGTYHVAVEASRGCLNLFDQQETQLAEAPSGDFSAPPAFSAPRAGFLGE